MRHRHRPETGPIKWSTQLDQNMVHKTGPTYGPNNGQWTVSASRFADHFLGLVLAPPIWSVCFKTRCSAECSFCIGCHVFTIFPHTWPGQFYLMSQS